MITKLTPSQEKEMITFREQWRAVGLSTEPVDKETAKSAITSLYQKIGKAPPTFIFCASPLEANLTINVCKSGILTNLRANLGTNLWDNLWENLWDNLWENLRANLGTNLWDNLWENLWENLGDNLRASLGANLGANLMDNLRENLGANLGENLWTYNNTYLWGSLDSYWIAYYQFMQKIGIVYDKKDQESLYVWADLARSAFWWWPYEDYCFVSDRPQDISLNADRRLHNEHGPAFKFRDGWKGFYLNGVSFPEELYKRVISGEMSMPEIQAIENIEQRTQAIKHAKEGIRDFFVSQNGILRDKVVKKDIKNRKINYELWEIPAGEMFNKNVFFAFYDDPSSLNRNQKREYMKGVPQCASVAEAMAWGMSDDTHVLSPEDWLALVPLAEES